MKKLSLKTFGTLVFCGCLLKSINYGCVDKTLINIDQLFVCIKYIKTLMEKTQYSHMSFFIDFIRFISTEVDSLPNFLV